MKTYIAVVCVFAVLISCEDIIEKDITNQAISILSPPDLFNPNTTSINFYWNYLEGADGYQLKVVGGRFDSILSFELDTFISTNQFTYNFDPGNYQWSLIALNSEYSTKNVIRSFKIDSSSNISDSRVILKFPNQGGIYSDSSLTLSWGEIFSATNYIVHVSEKSNGNLVFSDTTNSNSINTGKILMTKKYDWKVRAINSESRTEFTESSFELDFESPSIPVLTSPSNQKVIVVGTKISFSWYSGVDGEDNWAYDSLYLYTGSLNNAPKRIYRVTKSYVDSTLTVGSYFWKVKSFDSVDNGSSISVTREFTIQ